VDEVVYLGIPGEGHLETHHWHDTLGRVLLGFSMGEVPAVTVVAGVGFLELLLPAYLIQALP
jgi:hypothetical protein